MNFVVALAAVSGIFLVGLLGAAPGMGWIFGVVFPYLAVALFVGGLIHRVLSWAMVPVPFRIPTTCGQQKSLTWIRHQPLDNPHNTLTAIGRMALEVLFFRSLLRNTKSKLVAGRRLVHGTNLWLWLGAMAMHWSLLIILIRHLRLLTHPVPSFVTSLENVDGFLDVEVPVLFVTSLVFLAAQSW